MKREDFWNTINSNKVNTNILKDEDVCIVEENGINLIVIHVPRADFNMRPVYIGENPYKGTFKRNHEGDYHATEHEIRGMIRDQKFEFTNPGILKLPLEDIYRGGNSKSRNPHMQTMLRLVGFGDNAGSGFPTILDTWKNEGWVKPELIEDTDLNQVTLVMKMSGKVKERREKNFAEKNERSLSEVLSEVLSKKEFEKMLPIINLLEKHENITPSMAIEVCGKSVATVRRYLKVLTDTGYVVSEGSTNKVIYKKIK